MVNKTNKNKKRIIRFYEFEEDDILLEIKSGNLFSFIKKNNLLDENDKRKLKLDSVRKIFKKFIKFNNSTIYNLRKNLETLVLKNK